MPRIPSIQFIIIMHAKTGKENILKPITKHIAHILSHGRAYCQIETVHLQAVQPEKESQTALIRYVQYIRYKKQDKNYNSRNYL